MTAYEIIQKYTTGEKTLVETNTDLARIGAGFYLNINKNLLTEDEIKHGTAGLLDTGTGSLDKVEIIKGELKYAVNTVIDGVPNMKAFVLAQGKTFEVYGTKLIER